MRGQIEHLPPHPLPSGLLLQGLGNRRDLVGCQRHELRGPHHTARVRIDRILYL